MIILDTQDHLYQESLESLSPNHKYWFYSAMDSCITEEIRQKLRAQLDEVTGPLYAHTLDMQAPILDMMLRGMKVDETHRRKAIADTERELDALEADFKRICVEGLGLADMVNPGSHVQVKVLFYDTLGLKEIKKKNSNGVFARACDRETLEQLDTYFIAQPFVAYILAIRDKRKTLGFLRTPTDDDGRIRTSLSLAGTNTGRLNSSFSDFGTGTNLQNIASGLKYIFIADPGKLMVNIDLEQADSRNVGALCWNIFYDMPREEITRYLRLSGFLREGQVWEGPIGPEFAGSYLDACESGDLHTTVCRMAWTDLEWGSDQSGHRGVADGISYRTYSYRDMAKKLGHGSNYYGKPPQMASASKLPVIQVSEFQRKYFAAFPCIPAWHAWTIERLQTTKQLTHLYGRRRTFFGDLKSQPVINAAIAYCPQGMTGFQVNQGILNVWRNSVYELMLQVHDSNLFQIPWERADVLVPESLRLMEAPITLAGGRKFFVPLEAETGYNYGYATPDNPLGMKKWKGSETRKPPRLLTKKRIGILDME